MIAALAVLLTFGATAPGPAAAAAADEAPTPVGEVIVTPPRAPAAATLYKRLKSEPDVVICKRRQVAGSLLASPPICLTNIEWAELSARDQQWLRIMQSRGAMR